MSVSNDIRAYQTFAFELIGPIKSFDIDLFDVGCYAEHVAAGTPDERKKVSVKYGQLSSKGQAMFEQHFEEGVEIAFVGSEEFVSPAQIYLCRLYIYTTGALVPRWR